MLLGGPLQDISDMGDAKLLKTVERWLRMERDSTRAAKAKASSTDHDADKAGALDKPKASVAPTFPSRHMAYFS